MATSSIREVSISETLHESFHHVSNAHTNPLGIAHGGVVLGWMVDAATVTSMRLAQGPTLLAGMDNVFFLSPLPAGWNARVTSWASLVGRSSIEVTVMVEALPPGEGEARLTTLSHMTLIAVDERLKPRQVSAQVVPRGPLEEEIHREALERRRTRPRYQAPAPGPAKGRVNTTAESLFLVNTPDTLAYDVLHASRLLKAMDELAGIVGGLASRGVAVTAALDETGFHTPIRRGEIVRIRARVTAAWRSSLEAFVEVHALDPQRGRERLATTSYFTLVHIGEGGRSQPFPPDAPARSLPPTGEAEERRRQRLARLQVLKEIAPQIRSLWRRGL